MNQKIKILYFFIIYYFAFFYTLYIFNIGNLIIISSIKELLVVFLGVLMVANKAKGNSIKIKRKYFGLMLVYLTIILLAALRATSLSYAFIDLKYYFIWPLMIFISINVIKDYSDFREFLFHVNVISLSIGVVGLIAFQTHNSILLQWRSAFQIYAPKSILSTSFDFGALMALATFLNLIVIYYEKLNITRIFFVVFYAYMTFLSYTRGSYLCIILFVYLVIRSYYLNKLTTKKFRRMIKILIDLIVILGCIYVYFKFADVAVFSNESLLVRLNSVWPSLRIDSIFIGAGFGAVGRSIFGTAIYAVSDNSYIRIILSIGVIGLVSVLLIFGKLYTLAKQKTILAIIYISVGITAFFSDYIVFTPAMILVYCMIGICVNLTLNNKNMSIA